MEFRQKIIHHHILNEKIEIQDDKIVITYIDKIEKMLLLDDNGVNYMDTPLSHIPKGKHLIPRTDEIPHDISVEIPISNLKQVLIVKESPHNFDGLGVIAFQTFDRTIKVKDGFEVKYESYYSDFYMDFRKETNIDFRMKKAFIHLAHSCWKPVKGEPY